MYISLLCVECLRYELSEKQRLLDAREKELEVEHASSQRRLLQLERALDEKHKEVQSLKVLRTYTCSERCGIILAHALHGEVFSADFTVQ